MVSSRNSGKIGSTTDDLQELRQRIFDDLTGELFGLGPVFDIYLNELDHTAAAEPILTRCRELVSAADIVLVLYDGRAGWSANDAIGICHAEFNFAVASAARKVRAIDLPLADLPKQKAARERDLAFREQKERVRPWAVQAATLEEAFEAAKLALYAAVIDLSHQGAMGRGRQLVDSGDALDWVRMNYQERARSMVSAMRLALLRAGASNLGKAASSSFDEQRLLVLPIDGRDVLTHLHAIPAAMSVATAREMVGQPFLNDHLSAPILEGKIAGPLHLVACARGVTEAQAIRQLGYPDATIVPSEFGVYIADPVQKQQLVFLSDCRDEVTTSERVELFLTWLEQTYEDAALRARAEARAEIVKLIAQHL